MTDTHAAQGAGIEELATREAVMEELLLSGDFLGDAQGAETLAERVLGRLQQPSPPARWECRIDGTVEWTKCTDPEWFRVRGFQVRPLYASPPPAEPAEINGELAEYIKIADDQLADDPYWNGYRDALRLASRLPAEINGVTVEEWAQILRPHCRSQLGAMIAARAVLSRLQGATLKGKIDE